MTVVDVLREQFFTGKSNAELSNILWEAGFCPKGLPITFSIPPVCRECDPCCEGILKEEYVPRVHSSIFTLIREWKLSKSIKDVIYALTDVRNNSSPEDEAEFWDFSVKFINELEELISNSKFKDVLNK